MDFLNRLIHHPLKNTPDRGLSFTEPKFGAQIINL